MTLRRLILVSTVILVVFITTVLYQYTGNKTYEGIAKSNGRIEVQRIEVASQYPGRLIEVRVREGQMVRAGEIVALLDTVELNAQLAEAQALARQSTESISRARASLAHQKAQFKLAQVQLKRAQDLSERGFTSSAELDERTAEFDVAKASVNSAEISVIEAKAAADAAQARVSTLKANISNMTIIAPVTGRVEYRLAEPGTVLTSGSRVATLLDLTDAYMTVFFPTPVVGRLQIGAEARVRIDSISEYVIPANISYVAQDAQFTPKSVETADERTTFMYRVKLQFDTNLLMKYSNFVKAGMTGDAYVRTKPTAQWPQDLDIVLPDYQ